MVAILANPKWSEDLTIQMIIEYEKREYLWNPVSEHYKNKKIREQGYTEIINTLNLVDVTVKELKNKIKNIRSSYSVELKKIRAARKAGAHAYRPSVTWFEHADRFLRAIVTPSSVSLVFTRTCLLFTCAAALTYGVLTPAGGQQLAGDPDERRQRRGPRPQRAEVS